MDIDSDKSSDLSDVDPQAILDSLKGMDDLDADLFSAKKKPRQHERASANKKKPVAEKKKVTFQRQRKTEEFDMSDPLRDLLSDDESFKIKERAELQDPTYSNLDKEKNSPKSKDDDSLFGNDDDLLLSLGVTESSSKKSTLLKQNSEKSPLDNILPSKNTPTKTSTGKTTRFRFDKDGNFLKDSTPDFKQDVSFGAYTPSTTSSRVGRGKSARNLTMPSESPDPLSVANNDFLDFLNSDSSKLSEEPRNYVSPTSQTTSRRNDSLKLGAEVNTTSVDVIKPRLERERHGSSEQMLSEDSVTANSSTNRAFNDINKNNINLPPAIMKDVSPAPSQTTNFITEKSPANSIVGNKSIIDQTIFSPPPAIPLPRKSLSVSKRNSTKNEEIIPERSDQLKDIIATNMAHVGSTEEQLHQVQSLLHDSKLGFQRDLEITKDTYEGRVQTLHNLIAELRSRAEREAEVIKESYDARLDIVRRQVRESSLEAAEKSTLEHDEIKRLRSLHLSGLEEMRVDYDEQISRLKDAHQREVETLKSSMILSRNLTDIMEKVGHAADGVEKLASKYEAAFHAMSQKFEEITSSNRQLISVMQSKLEDIHRNNMDMQNNLQQSSSRLEGNISEMNRAFGEHLYQLQLEQKRLVTSQNALDNEKKSMLKQVASERTEAMKAHKEAIELRQFVEKDAREKEERFLRRDEELRQSQRLLEDSRNAEAKQASERGHERRVAENELARERSALAERSENIARLEAKLKVEDEEIGRRRVLLNKAEESVEKKMDALAKREEQLKQAEERHSAAIIEGKQALETSRQIEGEQVSRLEHLHCQANEIAKQRRSLAEERKQLIEDRLNYATIVPIKLNSSEVALTAKPLARGRLPPSDWSKGNEANAALWRLTAEKDQHFLDDEQIFLETLKPFPSKIIES